MTPVLDVVVVCYRSRDLIAPCLEQVREIPGLGTVVVVDHGDDGSAEVARAHGAKVIHNPANPGFAAGQNAGLAQTSAELVLLLNPDAQVRPDAVADGAALMVGRPDVAAIQGVILDVRTGGAQRSQGVELGALHLWGRALGLRRVLGTSIGRRTTLLVPRLRDHGERVPDAPRQVETLAATAVLVRRAALTGIGGFDASYFLYGEDLDLCRRLRSSGWALLAVPDVWATHLQGASSPSSWRRELDWWGGTLRFAARWWGPWTWISSMAAATVRSLGLVARHPRGAPDVLRSVIIGPLRARAQRRVRHRF